MGRRRKRQKRVARETKKLGVVRVVQLCLRQQNPHQRQHRRERKVPRRRIHQQLLCLVLIVLLINQVEIQL